MSESLFCYPLPEWLFIYIIVSFVATIPAKNYAESKGNEGKLSDFLCLFIPFVAFIYLFFSKTKSKKSLNSPFFFIWVLIIILFVIRRICGYT